MNPNKFSALLLKLINANIQTAHEPVEWDQLFRAVMAGSNVRDCLLEGLNLAAWKFSKALTHKLHVNFISHVRFVDVLATAGPLDWSLFHQNWTSRYTYLPINMAMLRTCDNLDVLNGIKELVGDRRAVMANLVRQW